MYIKFDEVEFFDFFENEPIAIGEIEEGNIIYSITDKNSFKIVLTLDIYLKKIGVSLLYNSNIVFSGSYDEVKEIWKSNDDLIVEFDNSSKRMRLKKTMQLGVLLESE